MAGNQSTSPRRICAKCNEDKAISDYYQSRRGVTFKRCKACCRASVLARLSKSHGTDPHGRVITRNTLNLIWRDFRLTPEEYLELLATASACEACGARFEGREPFIDHCHKSKKIRGLLCNRCNYAIGILKDDETKVAALLAYLKRPPYHKGECRRARDGLS